MSTCKIIIPTIADKIPILRKTLFGIRSQKDVDTCVYLGVDLKPGDQFEENLGDNVRIIPYLTDEPWNRSQFIVNDIVFNHIQDESTIVLMHDDYWMEEVFFLRRLIKHMRKGLCKYLHDHSSFSGTYADYAPFMFKHPVVRFSSISYFSGFVERSICPTLPASNHQHPFKGHPKCIMRSDFLSSGGFDTSNFKHYEWGDFDMFLRIKSLCDMRHVKGRVFHSGFPKYAPYEFEHENRNAFGALHPGWLRSIDQDPIAKATFVEFDDL